ncbi:MAG: hypothetical protein ACREBB_06490 [Nitrosotalea sp.]
MKKRGYLVFLIVISAVVGGLGGYMVMPRHNGRDILSTMLATGGVTDAPVPKDIVTVMIHDKEGNLIAKQTTNNIITTAGAAFYCIQAGLCVGGASGAIENPNISAITTPYYWVAFINGTGPNTDEPTAADCSVSSTNQLSGQTTGSGSSTTCTINFGSAPAQYPSGANNVIATLCVSATSCSGDLRSSSGIVDTAASSYTLATTLFNGCSPNNNGTAPTSGTCVNSQQTTVFSNNLSQNLTITGLALLGGSTGKTAATGPGPIVIAEAALSPHVSLNPGDTIQVTWQLTI